ncbi:MULTISPECIES: EboA domain-containing protein [Flavobacteriaceae]|uniref:EboA domain-containing protein n=1 Tax=Autumnicola psychrophila TaxID=3075592 RepID=A0ABU3DRK7_9FLAO|nr:EboA domain-containing protein [Zunongwangia sp. F225]MDT0686347.1 EboA domain-containing protein [Zunongwangia sp. F225]
MKQPQKLLLDWIAEVCSSEEVKWLEEEEKKFRSQGNERDLVLAFSKVPRKITRKDLNIGPEETFKAQTLKKNWHPENLDSEQAARILLLLSFASEKPEEFSGTVEKLLETADLNEQITIYSALPLFPNPERFLQIAYSGTRSNATSVFDTITLENPYPYEHFSEEAYNRLVLKAAFMERPFWKIVGIPERANPVLAELLLDLVSERWSAGREFNPLVWRLITPALTENRFREFKTRAKQMDPINEEAVVLAYEQHKNSSTPDSRKWEELLEKWETQKHT